MRSRFELDATKQIFIMRLDSNIDEKETDEIMAFLDNNSMHRGIHDFVVMVPKQFSMCEAFRIKIHRKLLESHKTDSLLKVAVVTTHMFVKGYEHIAKIVLNLVAKECVFETLDEALTWLKKK